MNRVKTLLKNLMQLVLNPSTLTKKKQTSGTDGTEDGTRPKMVTMGWDGQPMIVNNDGTIYCSKKVELIFYKEYYPNWPEEQWPTDPKTGKKLEIEIL